MGWLVTSFSEKIDSSVESAKSYAGNASTYASNASTYASNASTYASDAKKENEAATKAKDDAAESNRLAGEALNEVNKKVLVLTPKFQSFDTNFQAFSSKYGTFNDDLGSFETSLAQFNNDKDGAMALAQEALQDNPLIKANLFSDFFEINDFNLKLISGVWDASTTGNKIRLNVSGVVTLSLSLRIGQIVYIQNKNINDELDVYADHPFLHENGQEFDAIYPEHIYEYSIQLVAVDSYTRTCSLKYKYSYKKISC